MLKDAVLARIRQLNLKTSRTTPSGPLAKPSDNSSDHSGMHLPAQDLSQLPPGKVVANRWGQHWLRTQPIDQYWPDGKRWLTGMMQQLNRGPAGDQPPLASELDALSSALPEDAVYLDLETCGFAGSMVFLIGLIDCQNGRFCLSQLLARHYGEEKALFQTLWNLVATRKVLVTFNGKCFDWPMVQDRSTLHRLEIEIPLTSTIHAVHHKSGNRAAEPDESRFPQPLHCDLLHHARRRWKDKLPDCKLQTLERFVCRRPRSGDIAGRDIPAAYHDFVRSGDAWLMRSVLHHNALDLVTLLQLSLKLCVPAVANQRHNLSTSPNPD